MLSDFLKKNITSQAGFIKAKGLWLTARSSLTTSLLRQTKEVYAPVTC